LHRRPLEYQYLRTKFHENLPSGSKVISGRQADRELFWSYRHNLQCHRLHTKFHPIPPITSNVIRVFLCAHLRSLNVRYLGMVEGTGLENRLRGHPQWHHLHTKFQQLYQSLQKLHTPQKFKRLLF
jgi:hypothetical protein